MIRTIFDLGLTLTTSFGVSTVVENAVKAVTPSDISKAGAIATKIGAAVISSTVSFIAVNQMSEEIDNIIESVKGFKAGRKAKTDIIKEGE